MSISAAVAEPRTDAAAVQTVEVEGTLFKITLSDGRVLRSSDLIGSNLLIGQPDRLLRVRLDALEQDPDDKRTEVADADRIWLHSLSLEAPDGSWEPLCHAGPDGRRQAIPLHGRFAAADGRFGDGEAGAFELACTAGAMGKCIRFGYHPWQTHPWPAQALHQDISPSYLTLYNACLRMVRADYGGDGSGTTKDGMRIDLYDARGIQFPANDSQMAFEAGWTEEGAVCVNHPRVPEHITLADIEARWPRLAGKAGAICTEEFARAHGALLFNRSMP